MSKLTEILRGNATNCVCFAKSSSECGCADATWPEDYTRQAAFEIDRLKRELAKAQKENAELKHDISKAMETNTELLAEVERPHRVGVRRGVRAVVGGRRVR